QQRLRAATVLVLGLGGLGCPVAQYLAAAGVGRLLLIDDDRVDISNLQRQPLHGEADVGALKVDSAAASLNALNPLVEIVTVAERADAALLARWLPEVAVVADCCDNFSTRDVINACAWAAQVPVVSAAAIGWQGQLSVFDARDAESPCYRCLYPDSADAEQTCSDVGVMASTVGVMGSLQANEILKLIAGVGSSLCGQLLLWDGHQTSVRTLRIPRDSACPVCSSTE
ncbi:MAG: molybdopterin-synthase adenylyltransferase MoeB, partial [Paraperlucidibaca sp.]